MSPPKINEKRNEKEKEVTADIIDIKRIILQQIKQSGRNE